MPGTHELKDPDQIIGAILDWRSSQRPAPTPLDRPCNLCRGARAVLDPLRFVQHDQIKRLRDFINAASRREIVLTKGTTEAINLVAQSYCRTRLQAGDNVVITHLEHHANIVPWQLVCEQTGAELRVAPINDLGEIYTEELQQLIDEQTALVGIAHVSNALGTVNPVEELVAYCKARNVTVLVDGAQGVPHLDVDVQSIGCDFYAFSGHKMFGPTGTGVLYGREALLEAMPPWQGGGEMIEVVKIESSTYQKPPYKFEAGTPHIAGAIGLGNQS